MKTYNGAMLHGVNKQNVAPGELGKTISLNLGMIPEDVIVNKVEPLITQLSEVLEEYKVYTWMTTGYAEDKNTENEL